MALIQTQATEEAHGAVRAIYDQLMTRIPFVPRSVQLMSASPELMVGYWSMMQRILQHPRVSRELLALLRLGVAMDGDSPYCLELNSAALQMLLGLTDAQLAQVRQDPSKAELPEPELALALFAIRAVREPEAVAAADV